MTRKQFIEWLQDILHTNDIIYMDHNNATRYTPQIIEVSINDKPVSFVIDTTEWINNPGVKFTYNSIICALRAGELSKCVYKSEDQKYISNLMYNTEAAVYYDINQALTQLNKDPKNVSMTHVMYRNTGYSDGSIKLGGVYPKNHNVSFKTVIIGIDRYDLTISNEVV